MPSRGFVRVIVPAFLVVAAVLLLSLLSTSLWGVKQEVTSVRASYVVNLDMTVAEFGRTNRLSDRALKEAFGLREKAELAKKLGDLGLSAQAIEARARKAATVSAEYESKNWIKIPVKLALWLVMFAVMFQLLRKGKVTGSRRTWAYLAAVLIFGIALGSDPSPMGTLKDTIAVYGKKGIVFPPRAVVLIVFLLIGVIANKFVCAWGCQFGTLQDLLFRLGRPSDAEGRRRKVPYVFANTIRVLVVGIFAALALGWAVDIIAPVDPFAIFRPAAIMTAGGVFLGVMLLASLFVYRPWCHLACPFGLAGWLTEKFSVFKIQVNYDTCIACEKCSAACPSHAMEGILKGKAVKPDCFSCGTCMESCPTGSIAFRAGSRTRPPAGKFS